MDQDTQSTLAHEATEHAISLSRLRALPTRDQGHFDNLKIETPDTRVWLSRMTRADGAPYDNGVTIESLIDGIWTEIDQYEAED